jgi:hypothetical protein
MPFNLPNSCYGDSRCLAPFLYRVVLQQELEEIDAVHAKRFSSRRFTIAILDIHLLPLTYPTRFAIALKRSAK